MPTTIPSGLGEGGGGTAGFSWPSALFGSCWKGLLVCEDSAGGGGDGVGSIGYKRSPDADKLDLSGFSETSGFSVLSVATAGGCGFSGGGARGRAGLVMAMSVLALGLDGRSAVRLPVPPPDVGSDGRSGKGGLSGIKRSDLRTGALCACSVPTNTSGLLVKAPGRGNTTGFSRAAPADALGGFSTIVGDGTGFSATGGGGAGMCGLSGGGGAGFLFSRFGALGLGGPLPPSDLGT